MAFSNTIISLGKVLNQPNTVQELTSSTST